MILYRAVDLPPIPPELLVFDLSKTPYTAVEDIGHHQPPIYQKGDRSLNSCPYYNWIIDHQPLVDWIYQNIPGLPSGHELLYQSLLPKTADDTFIVHTDALRVCSLTYYLSLGGPSVINSWYRHPDHPLRIPKSRRQPQSGVGQVYYDDLELIDSFQFGLGRWYFITSDVLHDCDHIQSARSAVTVSYSDRSVLGLLGISE